MLILFQVCFGVGLGYSVLSFVLSHVLGMFGAQADSDLNVEVDINAELDTDFDFDSGSGAETGSGHGHFSVSPFKPTVIAAFLVVFGGVGLIALPRLGLYLSLLLAAVLGFFIGYVIYRYVYLFLYKAQNTSAVEMQSLIGTEANVMEFIPQGGYGKITYIVNGNTYSAPAKSEDGEEIRRNSRVEITSIQRNTYFVKKKLF